MTGEHPDELTLLAYVEGEPAGEPREAVAAHVASCAACRTRIRELEAGRDALRAAAPLELPAHRAETLVAELPARARERRVYVSPGRLVTVLAPLAALVAIAIGIASLNLGGDGVEEGAGEGAQTAPAMEGPPEGGGAEADTQTSSELASAAARVEGPPREVAGYLQARGFDARVVGRSVVVRDASANEVARALTDRRRGRVQVLTE